MRNRQLERKIELLKEFIGEWIEFRDFLKGVLKDKTIAIEAEEEKRFLEIKSRVARKYQGLAHVLEKDFIPDGRLMDIVSHAVSLESMTGTSDMQFRKIENDWHLSYIHLNELLGKLESERDRIAKVSRTKIVLTHFVCGVRRLCLWIVKLVVILILLAMAGLVGSYFLKGGENKDKGLVNYLVTTVKETIFQRGKTSKSEGNGKAAEGSKQQEINPSDK